MTGWKVWGLILLAVLTSGSARAQEARVPLALGDTTVALAVHEGVPRGERPVLDLLVLHDDENTAVEAGTAFVDEHGGRLVALEAQGARRMSFAVGGRAYSVDPNRIFTPVGAALTLGADSTAEAIALARLFGDAILGVYRPEALVVTLHNNTPDRYSARSYAAGGEYAADAEAVHLQEGTDPDDFFFVTDRPLFDALVRMGFNVVLQDNARVTDDGSLSVWAARQGLRYVNVEAEHGHLDTQRAMLRALDHILFDSRD